MTSPTYLWHSSRIPVWRALLDLAALAAAWRLTIEIRLLLNPWMTLELEREDLLKAAPPLGAVLAVWLLVAQWLRIYRREAPAGPLSSALAAGAIAVVVIFFSRELGASLSRSFVLLFVPVSMALLALAQRAAPLLTPRIEQRWGIRERVAMLGQGAEVRRVADHLAAHGNGGVIVTGVILPEGASGRTLGGRLPLLGTTRQLGEVINRERLDRIVIVEDRFLPSRQLAECARVSQRMGVVITRTLSAPEPDARMEIADLPGLRLLECRPAPFTRGQELAKRALDVVVASVLLAGLALPLGLVCLLIKLTSPGPVLFRSPRAGKGGRHFLFLKFRSMYVGGEDRRSLLGSNEQDGHLFKMRQDPRVTPLGRLLRRYSIDEMPQLVNVLRGEMSLVGPRPLPAEDLDPDGQSRRFHTWSEHRSRVLPGITGLWQIRGRSELTFDQMMELDLKYIRRWSVWLDLRILLATPLAVLRGRGAY